MKIVKLILISLLVIIGFAVILFTVVQKYNDTQAEQIISSFMDSKGFDIEPSTEEYKVFMRQIVWGEYPELTDSDSDFITKPEELDDVLNYAWRYSGYKKLYGEYDEPDIEEVTP